MRRLLCFALIALIALVGGSPTALAQVERASIPADRAARLTGLYTFADGTSLHVTDLADLVGGQSVLSVTEYTSGRLRALFPDSAGGFSAGPAWFRPDPLTYAATFDETRAPAPSLTIVEAGIPRTALRVRLRERDIAVRHGEITLAGTLVLPAGNGPHPAVVMIPGSGPLTRRTPRYVGDLLAARGVAVLIADKRGTGGSSGDWNALSHADWALDVHAQLDWLKSQPDIDATRLGLLAGSEGGFVAPLVAAARSDLRFLVCRVCSALPHGQAIVDMETLAMRRRGMSDPDVAAAGDLLKRLIRYALDSTGYEDLARADAAGQGQPWREAVRLSPLPPPDAPYWKRYRGLLSVDPQNHYARIRIPVLAILGERDERILLHKNRTAFEALRSKGMDLTLWTIAGASHGLLLDEGTTPRYPDGFHDRLARWIAGAAGVKLLAGAPDI